MGSEFFRRQILVIVHDPDPRIISLDPTVLGGYPKRDGGCVCVCGGGGGGGGGS